MKSFLCYNSIMKVLDIEKLDHFGRGISRIEGIPIFVENCLPSEKVEVEIIKKKKNYMEGKVKKYIVKSTDRIKPICPYYDECGGCDIMHLEYNKQLKYKEEKVKEILLKFSAFNNVKKIIDNEPFYYRNKITLQVKEKIGYYKKKSYDLVQIEKCFIVDDRINEIISRLNKIDLKNINQIVIRVTDNQIMLIFHIKNSINLDINFFNNVDTIVTIGASQNIVKGKGYIEENINDIKYVISPKSFFQVNTKGMVKLYNKVLEYCDLKGEENVLDLYCGTGTIGIYLSKYCKKVFGIELNEDAVKDAFKNKEINNIKNIDFKVGDVKEVLKNNNFLPDVIIVDPPRAGLDKKVIDEIIELQSEKLIYVSCDPVTLARDLNILKDNFHIIECTPVDMFPNTCHVECVVLMLRIDK